MDAVKFLQERARMCNSFLPDCEGCRVDEAKPVMSECYLWMFENPKRAIKIVEEWSAAHPRKTRQSVFLEQWPDTQLDKEGNVIICPKQLCKGEEFNKLMAACRGTNCYKCRRDFYTKGVE